MIGQDQHMARLTTGVYRVVDAHNQGWHPVGGPDGVTYSADYGFERGLADRTLDQLRATRGPLRPVEPITDQDIHTLEDLFGAAGSATITTLASALEEVFHQLRESQRGNFDGFDYARRTVLAGREGSWESQALIDVILFGNALNLAPAKRGHLDASDIEARRAAGPSTRVNKPVRDNLAAMFTRWVTDPDRYTEVAETLAAVISNYVDTRHGPDGWARIADQWLQPGGLAHTNTAACYGLFYSQSDHFNAALL